jgi:hypothetical protein
LLVELFSRYCFYWPKITGRSTPSARKNVFLFEGSNAVNVARVCVLRVALITIAAALIDLSIEGVLHHVM